MNTLLGSLNIWHFVHTCPATTGYHTWPIFVQPCPPTKRAHTLPHGLIYVYVRTSPLTTHYYVCVHRRRVTKQIDILCPLTNVTTRTDMCTQNVATQNSCLYTRRQNITWTDICAHVSANKPLLHELICVHTSVVRSSDHFWRIIIAVGPEKHKFREAAMSDNYFYRCI